MMRVLNLQDDNGIERSITLEDRWNYVHNPWTDEDDTATPAHDTDDDDPMEDDEESGDEDRGATQDSDDEEY
ncbi:hypothetical protein D1007_57819 [Hordeum vulgare]|nr:hypothetical protein D1007_57819 [Hordeum vulgare]